MQGIQSSPFSSSPLALQSPPETLRVRPAPGTVDRDTVRVTVANKDALPATEVFHDIAEQNGIKEVSVSIGKLEYADYATPPGDVRNVTLRFFPDLPDDKYSPELADKINRAGQQIESRLHQRAIVNVGPA